MHDSRWLRSMLPAKRHGARAQPAKPSFALGFLTGQEMDWLPEAIRLPPDELPNIEITISSQYSPDLASALVRGKLDVAFLRREARATDLMFKVVATEPFVVVLPSDHSLASHEVINPQDIVGETFIGVSNTAPVTRVVIDDYLSGPALTSGRITKRTIWQWRCPSSHQRVASRCCPPMLRSCFRRP